MKRFAIFILSHGRAKTITTFDVMRKSGYTGDMYVVIDNEDDQEPLYREKFGANIIQFDKRDYVPITDLGDLDDDRRIGVFARNFIQDKAQELGYKFHLQLDDDIKRISYRHQEGNVLKTSRMVRLDDVFEALCEYMDSAPFTSLSLGDQAYLIGGVDGATWKKRLVPKCMTTFLMRADDKQYFHMRMNDDITTSALNNMRGKLYYTVLPIEANTSLTQEVSGGMTEIYRDSGTYRKSFYSVMAMPSCCKVASMGINDFRVHHEINWNNCVPKILSDKYRRD